MKHWPLLHHWTCCGVGALSTQSGRWGMKHWPLLHHWTCSGVDVYTEWTVRHEALTLTASLNVFRCECLQRVGSEAWSTDIYCIIERVQVWVSTVSGQWSMKHWPLLHESPTPLMMSLAFCWNSQLGVGQAASALWMQATASSPFLVMTTSTDRWVR